MSVSLLTTGLPNAVLGYPYSVTLMAQGGTAPYSWFIGSGALPIGLSLQGQTISGTPTSLSATTFVLWVSDRTNAQSAPQSLSITVQAARPLLNFKNFVVDNISWTPILFPFAGSVVKAWINFTADLKLRSDASDSTTEEILLVTNGTQFVVPTSQPLQVPASLVLVYAQSVSGSQTVSLNFYLENN